MANYCGLWGERGVVVHNWKSGRMVEWVKKKKKKKKREIDQYEREKGMEGARRAKGKGKEKEGVQKGG